MADSQPGRSGVRLCDVCRKHKGWGEFSVYDTVCNVCHKWFEKEVDVYHRQPEKILCTANGGRACAIIPSCPLCRLQKFFEVTKHSKSLKQCYFCKSKTVLEGNKPKCSSCIKLLKKYHKMSDEQKQELVCSCHSGKARKCSSCLLVILLNDTGRLKPLHDVYSEVGATRMTSCFQNDTDSDQSSLMDVEIATNQDESEYCRIDLESIPKEYHGRAKEQLSNECEVVVTKIPLEEILKAIKLHSTTGTQSNHRKLKEVEVTKKKKKLQRTSSSPLNIISSATSTLGFNNKKSEEEGGSRHYNILNVNGTRLTLQKSTSAVSSHKTTKGQYVDGILRSAKIHQGASHDVPTDQKKAVVASSHPILSSSVQHGRKVISAKRKSSKDSSKTVNRSTQTDTTPGWDELVRRNSNLEKQLAEMRSRVSSSHCVTSNNMHDKLPSLITPPKSDVGEELLMNTSGKQKEREKKGETNNQSTTSQSHGVRRDSSPLEERRVVKRARLASTSSSSSATSRSSESESHSSRTHSSMQNFDDALDYENDDEVSQRNPHEEGYGSNDSDGPTEPMKEKKKHKKHREKVNEVENGQAMVSKDSKECQQQSKIELTESNQTYARKSMAKFRIPKRSAAESVVVFPPGSVGLPPLLQQNLEQVLKPSKSASETQTSKTNRISSRTNDDVRHSAVQKRSISSSSALARKSEMVQTTTNQTASFSSDVTSTRTIMVPSSHQRTQPPANSVLPPPQLNKETITSSLSKIAPIMNELQYLPQTCRPLPSVVGIRSLHPPKVSVNNSRSPIVSSNPKSAVIREERKNTRFFRSNRDQTHSSEEDTSDEDESSTACSARSPDTLHDVSRISIKVNAELPHSPVYKSDATSFQQKPSEEERAHFITVETTAEPSISPTNPIETNRSIDRSVTSESDSSNSYSSDSDSSKKDLVSPLRGNSTEVVAKNSPAAQKATETRTAADETEELDEDVLDLDLGEDEEFFFNEEQQAVKETNSSTHHRKAPLQTENLTSELRTPTVQIVSPAVRAVDRPSLTFNNKATSLPLNKSIFGSPCQNQQNSLRDDAITFGLCLELLSRGKCWYKERCPLVHDLNGQLIEYVISNMCACGELDKARNLLIATASPLSSFCHWLISTHQGQAVIEKVIDSHLECTDISNRSILVEKAIEIMVEVNPEIPINPKMAEKAIFAAHATVSTAKLLVRLYERFESHRLKLSMKCWEKITCVLAELRNREHTLMAVSIAQKQHPEYSASVRVMDFLLASSLDDEIKVVQVCNLFKNYSESTLRVLPRNGMINLLDALDKFNKPMIFKYFANKFGLHLLPRCEMNNPIQSTINCVPPNSNVASLSQTTSFQPMVVLPGMPRKIAPQLFNRVNATTRSSSSDLSDGRISPANEVCYVPIIPLSPVNKPLFPLVPISIPKPQQPLDSHMFSARPREDHKQSLVPTPLSISIPQPQQPLDSQMFSARPLEDQKQSLVRASLSHEQTTHEEPTLNIQSLVNNSVDRPPPVEQDIEQKLRRMMEQGDFGAVSKLLLALYEHEKDPKNNDAIIDCFLLAIKSVKVPSTDIYLSDCATKSEFLTVGDIVVLILSEACNQGPPEELPPSQKQAIEDLTLSTLHYLTTVSKLNSKKINQRNQEIAHEFLYSLFSFHFNIPELLKNDPSLILFCVEYFLQNEGTFNSDEVIFMLNLLILFHKEITRHPFKLNRAMIDEEFSLSDKIVRIAAMMEEGENCDLNAIASVMEEYKEIYLSNKTLYDEVPSMQPYD